MTDFWGHMAGVIILILMALFIGVWVWAWRPRHRQNFERMARVPLEHDDLPAKDDGPEQNLPHAEEDVRTGL